MDGAAVLKAGKTEAILTQMQEDDFLIQRDTAAIKGLLLCR